MESLKAFTIGDEVVNHKVIDGVLYEITDEGLELILYPMGKTNVTYHVPSGVSEFRGRVFQHLDVDAPNFYYKNPYLESFTIDPDHETFKVENGILYSKDGSELVLVPPQKDLVEYRVDASVDKIHDYAFFSNDSVKRIVFEHGVEDGLMPYNSTLFNRHSDVTLYVHDDLVEDYKNDLMWSNYSKDRIEPISNLE